jgi:hypothetical protein
LKKKKKKNEDSWVKQVQHERAKRQLMVLEKMNANISMFDVAK